MTEGVRPPDEGDADGHAAGEPDPGLEFPPGHGSGPSPLDSLIDTDPETERPNRRRNAIIGAGIAVLVVAAAITAVLLVPSDASGYSDDIEANFMAACTEDGGDGVEPVCACLYAEIVESIPFDRFEEVNDALETERASDPEADVRLPADFDEIRASCVEDEGTVVTVDDEATDSSTWVPADDTSTTSVAESPTTADASPETAPETVPPS